MKGENFASREDYIKESITKWETIEAELLEKFDFDYPEGWEGEYWQSCGYCNYYNECRQCSLNEYVEEYFVCFGYSDDEESHAYLTLENADMGNYTKALKHCRIVLKFMREDLEKEG